MFKQSAMAWIGILAAAAIVPACQKSPTPPANQAAAPLADDDRVVRVFNIDDLLKSKWLTDSGSADNTPATQPAPVRMDPDELIAKLKQALHWKDSDGKLLIKDGQLIVNGTRKMQQQIFAALNDLRTATATGTSTTKPAPIATTQPNPAAPIKPGDSVRISIYDLAQPGVEYLKIATISENGTVDILYLGNVKLEGLTPAQAAQKIGQTAVDKHALLPAGNGVPGPQVTVTPMSAAEMEALNAQLRPVNHQPSDK